jgi:hypothetical protein
MPSACISTSLVVHLAVEGEARLGQPRTRNVEAVLDVVEQAARQRLDEPLLDQQRVGGDFIGADPIAVVEDAQLPVDHPLGAAWRFHVPRSQRYSRHVLEELARR